MQKFYNEIQLAKLVDVNYNTLRYWVKYDLLLPAEVMNSSDAKAIFLPESEKTRITEALQEAKKSGVPRDIYRLLLRTRNDAKPSKCFNVSSICNETGCARRTAMNAIYKVTKGNPSMAAFDVEYFTKVKAEIETQKDRFLKKIKTQTANVIRTKNVVVNVGDMTVSMSDVAARKIIEDIRKQLNA